MLHHLSFAVADLTRSAAFYDAALAPLGYTRVWTQESGAGRGESAVGYGLPGGDDQFAIRLRSQGIVAPSEGFHVAFRAPSQEAATAFHKAALAQRADGTMEAWAFIPNMVRTISPLSLLILTDIGSKPWSMKKPPKARAIAAK
jgi:catechol 2,3-dioxygenase-like lactoylglutathione lyase family enzyme